MDDAKQYALDVTTEIVVAKMSNTTITPTGENGVHVAAFFQAIYDKILEIALDENDD